jgi:hypothetical protein
MEDDLLDTPELNQFRNLRNSRALAQEEALAQSSAEKGGLIDDIGRSMMALPATLFSGDVEIRRQAIQNNPELSNYQKAKQLRDLPPEKEAPDTVGTAMGTGATESGVANIAIGLLAKRVPVINGAGRVRSALQNTINQYGDLFRRNPVGTTLSETLIGGVAGGGGFTLKDAYPDLPAAQFIGEMTTGLGVGLGLPYIAKNLTPTGIIVNKGRDWFSLEGATSRAATRMQGLADPEVVLARLRSGEELSPNAALTTAQRTGQSKLIALENTIVDAANDGTLSQQYADALQQTNQAIKDDLDFGGTFPEDTQQFFAHQVDHYRALLDARMAVAAERANQAALKVSPNQTKEALETAVREEVEAAYREARGLENSLFEAVDPELPVDVGVSKSARNNWSGKLPEAQKENMPSAASYLDPTSSNYIGRVKKNKKGEALNTLGQTTVFELRGVQSALRAEARAARSGEVPNRQKAMIADELADSITEDISRIYMDTEGDNPVAMAVAYSRELNQRFSQGTVGKILGKSGTGAARLDPSVTLSRTLGISSASNKVAYDQILTAVEGNPAVQASMEDFLKHNFFRGSEFDAAAANRFLNSNEDLMARMPVLRDEVNEAIRTGDATRLKRPRGFADPKVNKAIIFTGKGPDEAFNSIVNSMTTGREMQQLVRMAARDVTGEATAGLRTSFTQWVLKNASDNAGNVNGASLATIFDDRKTKIMINQLFDKSHKARFERVVRTAKLLDTARTAGTLTSIGTDKLDMFSSLVARVTGAKVGRQVSNTIQGPAIFAQKFQELMQAGIANPAEKLLIDAIDNEELFKSLMAVKLGGKNSNRVLVRANRAINAWMGVTLKNLATEEEQQQQPAPTN